MQKTAIYIFLKVYYLPVTGVFHGRIVQSNIKNYWYPRIVNEKIVKDATFNDSREALL